MGSRRSGLCCLTGLVQSAQRVGQCPNRAEEAMSRSVDLYGTAYGNFAADVLVSRVGSSLTNPLDPVQDQIRSGGPHERSGILVMSGQVLHDRSLQRRHAAEHTPADLLLRDLREE